MIKADGKNRAAPASAQFLKERLAQARRLVSEEARTSPKQVERTLHERARKLAEVAEPVQTQGKAEFLAFHVGRESFALPLESVREVALIKDYAVMPHAPRGLLGVVSLRGELFTLVDLLKVLSRKELQSVPDEFDVVVLRSKRDGIAFPVDSLGGIVSLPKSDILPPPVDCSDRSPFVTGFSSSSLAILNAEKLLEWQPSPRT